RAPHVEELVDADDEQKARLGNVEAGERRRDDHERGARHAGHALAGEHQQQQHGDLLGQRQLDVVGLRDEQRGEGAIHHRAVEIEGIPHRQDEADDLLGDRELLELLHRLRIGRLAAGGAESEQERLADQADQAERVRTEYDEPRQNQDAPQYGESEIELDDELAVGHEDAEALRRDDRGHGREHRQRRQRHDVAGDLQYDLRQLLNAFDQRARLLAQGCAGNAEKQREHHDLQDFVGRHGFDDRAWDEMGDELLHRQRSDLQVGGGLGIGQRQIEVVAGTQDVDEDHAGEQRCQRRADEPGHGLGADAADLLRVAHVRDADDQRREHERGDDHLDQAQEDVGDQRDVVRDGLGGFRIGPQDVAGVSDQ